MKFYIFYRSKSDKNQREVYINDANISDSKPVTNGLIESDTSKDGFKDIKM